MIRSLAPGDGAAMAALHAAAFQQGWSADEFERLLQAPGALALGSRLVPGGALIGLVLATAAADDADVATLAVHPDHRGQKIGASLMFGAIAGLRALGVRRLFLEAAEDNHPALAVYRRFGFEEVGRRRAYYADGGDALVLRLALRGA